MIEPVPDIIVDAHGRGRGVFRAMASPWEVHVSGASPEVLRTVTVAVAREVQRIEAKYSRYRDDGVVHRLHRAAGQRVTVDEETARLLGYADALWRQSEGRFDITTGVLRRVWTFDGSDRVPTVEQVAAVLPDVGWAQVGWDGGSLSLRPGMQIDFGGIGKEYAVDRALALAVSMTDAPVLINGGGDLAASAPPVNAATWSVGIDTGTAQRAPTLRLTQGAVATSGDAHRYLLREGVRYGHVLDPRTGWPVAGAPRSVTVLASSCSEAGSHATLALLMGAQAEAYLEAQAVACWIHRDPADRIRGRSS